MLAWLSRLVQHLRAPRATFVHVTSAQSLGPGLAVYAIDVDGRRIILGATARGLCVLDRYPVPNPQIQAGATDQAG